MTPTNTPYPTRRVPPALVDRRSVLRGFLLASGAVAAGPVLSACGSDDEPAGESAATGSGGEPTPGGELTIGRGDEVSDFDPYNHVSRNFPILNTIYSYLITYDDNYQAHPDIAESWTIADDALSVEIVLRDAVFHDGSPVTASDVVAGIERAQDPDRGLSIASSTTFIDTASEVDEKTVRVTFNAPTSESRVLDFMYWFPIVQASGNDPDKLLTTPAGSGPFTLDAYDPGNNLVLLKNPDYYAAELPYLDRVEFRFFGGKDPAVAALEAGDIDGALGLDGRHYDVLKDRFTIVNGAPGALIVQFSLNTNMPPFNNKQVRQAVARAIDRDRMIEQVQFGVGQAVYSIFPPNSPAFDEQYMDEYGFDLQAAEALLADVDDVELRATATVNEVGQYNIQNLEIMKEDLASIGFELEIDPREPATASEIYRGGEAQCYMGAASNAFQSVVGITSNTAYRTNDNPMLDDNVPDEYLAVVETAGNAVTSEDDEAAAAEMNEVLMDLSFAVGVYTLEQPSAFKPEVLGYTRTAADHPLFTEVHLGE